MPSAPESRAALQLLTESAVATALQVFDGTSGSPEARRLMLLNDVPAVIGYYADGAAALAADFYEDSRSLAGVTSPFVAAPVVVDRTVKIRSAIAWAAQPLFEGAAVLTLARLAEVVQPEVARPFRDTITHSRSRDPEAVGWRRVTHGGCKFCRMLADRGAVFRREATRFAAHPNCHCGAEPVFGPNDTGEEASVMQYVASKKHRTAKQRAELRDYLNSFYEDFPG